MLPAKHIISFSILLILIGIVGFGYFAIGAYQGGHGIYDKSIDYTISGQFGDFVGGVVGTVFALSGTLLIYLSFSEQTKQNKRETFETTFLEMLRLHKENVNELTYTKFYINELQTSEKRKVFRIIFQEFIECLNEVRKFAKHKNIDELIKPEFKLLLQNEVLMNRPAIVLDELVKIDIAYNIVFFGLGVEGEMILRHDFRRKYKDAFFYPLLKYMKLKPKQENFIPWSKWKNLNILNHDDFAKVNSELYKYPKNKSDSLSELSKRILYSSSFAKYYGGHQHRLGHYFRHLFNIFNHLKDHPDLNENQKKFYARMIRTQLSTYEQLLLLVNSISTLGMKWELFPDKKNPSTFITKYDLIRNLPGYHLYNIRYKDYYPDVNYETNDFNFDDN